MNYLSGDMLIVDRERKIMCVQNKQSKYMKQIKVMRENRIELKINLKKSTAVVLQNKKQN